MVGQSLVLAVSALMTAQLGGTQPGDLVLPPEPSSSCSCHDDFNSPDVVRPGQSYRATMMALSARDPIFRAAFNVAYEDRPDLSELCLRCHAPAGWLNDRSKGDLSALIEDDLEGVTCDVCHRMVPTNPPLVGSGQYTISPSTAKRAGRGMMPTGGHMVVQSDYPASSESCAICHSLFNPVEDAHDAVPTNLGFDYYEQRTFEEWQDSTFSRPGEPDCVACHMRVGQGSAVRDGPEYSDLKIHSFVGGNRFAIDAVAILNRGLFSPAQNELRMVREWVKESLAEAARLEITNAQPRLMGMSGQAVPLNVRLTNLTGHKLPTGYPEGRRVYLEVTLSLDGHTSQIVSGEWNQETGDVIRDPQLRAYETEHGRVENGVGRREHSLILMNQIITDTRIPPRGFDPSPGREDMLPQGRDYGDGPPYRHWDDHTYMIEPPSVFVTTTGTVTVRAMYQSTDGEVIRYLLDRTAGSPEAAELEMVWEALAHAPPQQMARVSIPIVVQPAAVVPDAGVTSDAMIPDGNGSTGGGCGCTATEPDRALSWLVLLVFLPFLRRRR